MFRRILPIVVILAFAGCEKTDADSIDKWVRTESGPGKLKKAVADEGLDAELSAQAAANLIKPPLSKMSEVKAMFEKMSPPRRQQVLEKLAPRLWGIARVEGEKQLPGPTQVTGKDALVMIRAWADDKLRAQIDGYLVDWYAVLSYEKRAETGEHLGAMVVRMVGAPFSKRMIDVSNGFIAGPGQEKAKNYIHDELLLGMAATGTPETVKKLLEIATMDRGDKTLRERAVGALWRAYVNPGGLFAMVPPDALVPNLDALVAIAKDEVTVGRAADAAVQLIAAVGEPKCLDPLVGMIGIPHRSLFKYVIAHAAMRCGGAASIGKVVRALPEGGAYTHAELTGSVSGEIAKLTPRPKVLEELRSLLGEKSTVAKWTAIEALAAMKSVEDKGRIEALAGSKDRLVGYWGEASEGKPDPTLGQRAKELAEGLK
jgi:hypothetical protein